MPDSSGGEESACSSGDPGSIPGLGSHWRRDRLPTPLFLGFPCGSTGKESACSVGDLGSIPGLGRSRRRGKLPTPVFWSGEFHGLYSPWDRKESDTTEWLSLTHSYGGIIVLAWLKHWRCFCLSALLRFFKTYHPMSSSALAWASKARDGQQSQPKSNNTCQQTASLLSELNGYNTAKSS